MSYNGMSTHSEPKATRNISDHSGATATVSRSSLDLRCTTQKMAAIPQQ
jgi:hypothetical protein